VGLVRNGERRALVLGGGGVTGIAWEHGILTGLLDAGVDLTEADLVVGTSAGAAVAAQITSGAEPHELFAAMHMPAEQSSERFVEVDTDAYGAKLAELIANAKDVGSLRIAIGAMALAAPTVAEAERLEIIAARLSVRDWPARQGLVVTAVDAESGEFVAFDRDSGVPLVHAVAASCAVPGVWPPVTIGGRRYMDGGVGSLVNIDLAAGCERIVVIAPLLGFPGLPIPTVLEEAERLRVPQQRVVVISPDEDALNAIGPNLLDPRRQPAAADAGYRQASAAVSEVGPVWIGNDT
jgi:NTE family protein